MDRKITTTLDDEDNAMKIHEFKEELFSNESIYTVRQKLLVPSNVKSYQ